MSLFRSHVVVGAASVALALASLRCSASFSPDFDAGPLPPPPDATSLDAASDAPPGEVSPDASTDGGGDPRLDRAPAASCYTELAPSAVPTIFPGYTADLFMGTRLDASVITSTVGQAFYCPSSGLLRALLSYGPPAASHRPSFGVIREGVPTAMVVDYVLEGTSIPEETTEDVLVGPFVRSVTADGLLVLAVARRSPSEELALVRKTQVDGGDDSGAVPLGTFTYPVRVRLATTPAAGGKVKWDIVLQDRKKRVARSGEEIMPAAPFGVLFGTTRTAPGGPTTAIFSEVKLP
jgi:hypothetical protein